MSEKAKKGRPTKNQLSGFHSLYVVKISIKFQVTSSKDGLMPLETCHSKLKTFYFAVIILIVRLPCGVTSSQNKTP